jgi:hypothetical protein
MQTVSSLEIKKDGRVELMTAVADAVSLVQMYEQLEIPNINRKRRNHLASILRPLYRVIHNRKEEQCATLRTKLFKVLSYLDRSTRHHIGKSWLRVLIQTLQSLWKLAPNLPIENELEEANRVEKTCLHDLVRSLARLRIEQDEDEQDQQKQTYPIVDLLQRLHIDRYILQRSPLVLCVTDDCFDQAILELKDMDIKVLNIESLSFE